MEPMTTHILRNRLDIKKHISWLPGRPSIQPIPILLIKRLRLRGRGRMYTNSLNDSHLLIPTLLGSTPPPNFGLEHVMCFSQWNISKVSRGLVSTCTPGLSVLPSPCEAAQPGLTSWRRKVPVSIKRSRHPSCPSWAQPPTKHRPMKEPRQNINKSQTTESWEIENHFLL